MTADRNAFVTQPANDAEAGCAIDGIAARSHRLERGSEILLRCDEVAVFQARNSKHRRGRFAEGWSEQSRRNGNHFDPGLFSSLCLFERDNPQHAQLPLTLECQDVSDSGTFRFHGSSLALGAYKRDLSLVAGSVSAAGSGCARRAISISRAGYRAQRRLLGQVRWLREVVHRHRGERGFPRHRTRDEQQSDGASANPPPAASSHIDPTKTKYGVESFGLAEHVGCRRTACS